MKLHRPDPIPVHAAQTVDRKAAPEQVATRLRDGEVLLVTDHYGTGVRILDQLLVLMPAPPGDAPFAVRQDHRRALRDASLRLLAPIKNHRLDLHDANTIGFLKKLYPDMPSFFLPFIQAQELHGAWSKYLEGVHLPVLGHRVHPFYGTYAPTRMAHLEVFGTWLSQYKGPRTRAVDVGTGCGVLALMLCRAGFERVLATDLNPNAVESVSHEVRRLPSAPPIDVACGDLLSRIDKPVELIVFNPPWLHGEIDGLIARALQYDDGFFERFFDQAVERLTPDGRLVIIFSNVGQLVQPQRPHPILAELERGRLRQVQLMNRRIKPPQPESGPRRRTKEKVQVWELALASATA
jgi:hypothetical protein